MVFFVVLFCFCFAADGKAAIGFWAVLSQSLSRVLYIADSS